MSDGTQYLIDIAAKMAGGDATSAKLEEIADRLTGTGASVATFEAAIARAESALAQTAAASTAANTALQEAEQRYAQMERAADKAAKAVERAAAKGGKQANMHVLARDAHVAAQALVEEAAALDKAKAAAAGAAAAHNQMGGALKNLQAGAKQARASMPTGKVNELAEGFGQLGGPLGNAGNRVFSLADGLGKLKGALGSTGAKLAVAAAGIAIVIVGVVALTAAVITGTAAIATWAVKLADAGRSGRLTTAALAQTHDSLANLERILPGVADATGLSDDALRGLAKQLAEAKVSAADMPAALKAVALAEAALEGGGAAFVEQMRAGKKSVAELAAEAQSKFGKIVADKLNGLSKLSDRLRKNLGKVFSGLDIEPLLKGLSRFVDMFKEGTVMARTMKFLFEGLFQPIINGVTKAIPIVESFFIGMAIGALKVYIAFKPTIKAAGELLGMDDDSFTSALGLAKSAGELLAFGIIATGVVIAGVFAAIGVAAYAIISPIAEGAAAAAAAWGAISAAGASVVAYLSGISLSSIGTSMINGLAAGIKAGAQAVISAITGVVGSGIAAAEALLKINSPSKVFMAMGASVGEGFVGGVEDVDTRGPLERMVEPPKATKAGGQSAGGGRITIGDIHLHGIKDPEEAERRVRDVLLSIFEGDVLQLGGDLEPEPEPA